VGAQAVGAVFHATFCITEAAAALIAQAVKGTIAEQTAEGLRVCTGMAGKILTFTMLEKIIIRHILSSLR
jgi:hypothetical protein